jgi:ankyrin repeat protein
MESLLRKSLTIGSIKKAILELPRGMSGLETIYNEAISRIDRQEDEARILARRILCWITTARHQLSIDLIRYAMAIQDGSKEFSEDFCPGINVLGSICAGLVAIEKDTNVVRLVHYTTKEYFEKRDSWILEAEKTVTSDCLSFLLTDTFGYRKLDVPNDSSATYLSESDPAPEIDNLEELEIYICTYWVDHLKAANIESDSRVIDILLDSSRASRCGTMGNYAKSKWADYSFDWLGIHFASYYGLQMTVKKLLDMGESPNMEDKEQYTALSYAHTNFHNDLFRFLLRHPATDLNVPFMKSTYGKSPVGGITPLRFMFSEKHADIARDLIETGKVQPNPVEDNVDLPLHLAVQKLQLDSTTSMDLIKQLLSKGADPDRPDQQGRTPVSYAAGRGSIELVELFLSLGADPDGPDDKNRTPLSYAATRNCKTLVELLLSKGADADRPDNNGRAPISYAVQAGYKDIVKLFMTKGVQVSRPDRLHGGIMMHALKHKDIDLMGLLYDAGADIDVLDARFETTPLIEAVSTGRADIIKFLVDKGATIDAGGPSNETALWKASRFKHQEIAMILLEAGADPLAKAIGCYDGDPDDGKSALEAAKENRMDEVVKIMEKVIQQRQTSSMRTVNIPSHGLERLTVHESTWDREIFHV